MNLRGLTLHSHRERVILTASCFYTACQKIVFWSFVIPKEITFIYQRFVQQNKFSLLQYKKSFSVKPAFYFLTTEHKINILLLIVFLFCNIYIKHNLRIPFWISIMLSKWLKTSHVGSRLHTQRCSNVKISIYDDIRFTCIFNVSTNTPKNRPTIIIVCCISAFTFDLHLTLTTTNQRPQPTATIYLATMFQQRAMLFFFFLFIGEHYYVGPT